MIAVDELESVDDVRLGPVRVFLLVWEVLTIVSEEIERSLAGGGICVVDDEILHINFREVAVISVIVYFTIIIHVEEYFNESREILSPVDVCAVDETNSACPCRPIVCSETDRTLSPEGGVGDSECVLTDERQSTNLRVCHSQSIDTLMSIDAVHVAA